MAVQKDQHGSEGSVAIRALARVVDAQARIEEGGVLPDHHPEDSVGRLSRHSLLEIMRHRAVLDWVITRLATGRVRPRLRRVLRWGMCQTLYMEGIPSAIAADVCVRFVKKRFNGTEARFANALLRRFLEHTPAELLASVARDAPAEVATELGGELYRHWTGRFDEGELDRLGRLLCEPAPVTVRLRAGAPEPRQSWLTPLPTFVWAEGEQFWESDAPTELFRSAEFAAGHFYVQDPSTLLAPKLLGVHAGERVADLCAAPGGKAIVLAEALGGAGHLFCMDRSQHRFPRLRENMGKADGISMVVADAAGCPIRPGSLDAVLLDVPCSNTGVVRRRPDVRWHFSRTRLLELIALQADILRGAAATVRRGGRLAYSTCSIEPEENAQLVRGFLAETPTFVLDEEQQLLPQRSHDGCYAALLRRM